MKFKFGATIPVTSFGNLMPEIEVEAETYEAAYAAAMPKIEEIWARYCEPGRELRGTKLQKLDAYVGGSVYFDPINHIYYGNEAGTVRYTSGSEYAHQFEAPFDQAKVAAAMAKKYSVATEDIVKMWAMKAEISRGIGTALHAAIELYGEYDGLAQEMERTALHDNPMVMEAVRQFFAVRGSQVARHEAVIASHDLKRAGRVDRLVLGFTGKVCAIEDIKTDVNIFKKLPVYSKQLNFYRSIMEADGWKVKYMHVVHWDGGKWNKHIMNEETV